MLTFDYNDLALKTDTAIATMITGSSIYLHVYFESNETASGTILYYGPLGYWKLHIVLIGETNYYTITHVATTSNGTYTLDVLPGGHQQIVIIGNFQDSDPTPIVYINAVLCVLTTVAPVGTVMSIDSNVWYLGGEKYADVVVGGMNGSLGEVAFFPGTWLSASQAIQLTTSRVMRLPLQFAGCKNYWALDEVPDGVAYATAGTILTPSADVLTPWNTATPHYTKINGEDTELLVADANDDNETEKFECTTTTIPAGKKLEGIVVDVRGQDNLLASSDPYCKLGCGGDTALQLAVVPGLSLGWAPSLAFFVAGTDQASLDALYLYLITGTVGSASYVNLARVNLTPYYTTVSIRDYIGSVHLKSVTSAVGFAQNYLSYP